MPLGAFRINSLAKFKMTAAAEVIRSKKGITAVGNAQVDTAQSKFGGSSALFDGTSDYLEVNPYTDNDFGTTDFTIEGWVRFNSTTGVQVFYDKRVSGGATGILLYYNGGFIYHGNGSTRISGGTATAGVWYHWAVSRSSGSTKMFIDGTQVGTTYSDSQLYSTANSYFIGANRDSVGANGFNGWFDEFRISNTARYTANFTPPTQPFVNDANTLLLLHMDGTDAATHFEDDNGVGRAKVGVMNVGSVTVETDQSKFGGASAKFTNTVHYLETRHEQVTLGSGDFTVECWAYFISENTRSSGSSRNCLINSRRPDGIATGAWGFYWDAANSNKLIWEQVDGSGTTIQSSNNAISTGSWLHLAAVRSGTTITLYVNGTSVGSGTASTNYDPNWDIYIGWWGSGFNSINGYIDDLRVSSSARYTANFTPATTPFVNDANTLILLHGNGTDGSTYFEDDNGVRDKKGVVAIGNAQIDTAQSKFGGASALFDGNGDYLTVSHNGSINFGTGDFTIECWA